MSDRLSELQRQRALVQSHLAWLDQEIAAAANKPVSPFTYTKTAAQPMTKSAAVNEDAEAIMAEYSPDPKSMVESIRTGCFRWFAVALVLLVLGIYGLYRYSQNFHAHDAPPKAKAVQASPESR